MHVWISSAVPRKPQSAVQLFLCFQELRLWKHQSPQFIRAGLINIAVGSHLNWGQHWKLQPIQAQTSKSEAKDRWDGIKRVSWGVMMETPSGCWYWAFWKAALAASAVSPSSTPCCSSSAQFCYSLLARKQCGWAFFSLAALNSACASHPHPDLTIVQGSGRFPMLGFVPSTPERMIYKPAIRVPL